MRCPARASKISDVETPIRLLRMVMPDGRAVRVAQDFEDRKGTSKERIESGARLHHDELTRRGGRGDRGRRQREHVVVARQRTVRDHFRVDVDRHRGSILQRNWSLVFSRWSLVPRNDQRLTTNDHRPRTKDYCVTSACSATRWRPAAIATAYVIVLVLDLNPALPLHPVSLAPLVATVGLFYAVHLTVIFYILLVAATAARA